MIPISEQEVVDERKAHERLLNRLRVKRYRNRTAQCNASRNGSNDAVMLADPETGEPNATLTRVARHLADGCNGREALRKAGSSEKATKLLDKARVSLADTLKAHSVSIGELARSTGEALSAKKREFDGKTYIEAPDWQARAAGRRDAIQLLDRAGELPAAQAADGSGARFTVVYNHVDLRHTGSDNEEQPAIDVASP